MTIEPLLKRMESIIVTLLTRKPRFTGQVTLVVNFYQGRAKDITKEIMKERIKFDDSTI